MKNGKIYVAGIGPGCEDDITPGSEESGVGIGCRGRI